MDTADFTTGYILLDKADLAINCFLCIGYGQFYYQLYPETRTRNSSSNWVVQDLLGDKLTLKVYVIVRDNSIGG